MIFQTNPVGGLLLVDKPPQMTSHDVVDRVRKLLGRKDVGHTGTLDPMATGLMVLLVGEATKLSSYILNDSKAYRLQVLLGKKTDTGDITGRVVQEVEQQQPPANEQWESALQNLMGEFDWPVPIYSAVKVGGEKLYEKAHRGETLSETPVKRMVFSSGSLVSSDGISACFELSCSKGSFVRTWAEKMGESLGTLATLSELRRITCAGFHVAQARTLQSLESLNREFLWRDLGGSFIPLSEALPHFPAIVAKGQEVKMILNGQISKELKSRLITAVAWSPERSVEPQIFRILEKNALEAPRLLALVGLEPGQGFQIRRVFIHRSES